MNLANSSRLRRRISRRRWPPNPKRKRGPCAAPRSPSTIPTTKPSPSAERPLSPTAGHRGAACPRDRAACPKRSRSTTTCSPSSRKTAFSATVPTSRSAKLTCVSTHAKAPPKTSAVTPRSSRERSRRARRGSASSPTIPIRSCLRRTRTASSARRIARS